ncbi:helix-turn-helix domain-containing protein [Streptomyces fructofermentans]|uniref:Transcriptional regulator n=1 Tax=Streptomyces fructofermentans TaxID=152141 RepID=A0A918NV02_9ACTN|nr:helix-turn-helix transcriptional regulator [Streptomyces fructofermentans]GGX97522.1 transcriptional regulator [Streptomyces fructofermentans]
MSTPSPAVQRLRLRTELRKARNKANLTQREVAATMDWHPSKLIRIEAGEVAVTVNDLKALLGEYSVTDRRKIDSLLALARGSRKLPFSEYRDVFSREFLSFLALESSASIIRGYHFFVVPGLFQTEEYIRALVTDSSQDVSADRLDRLVEARLARQEILEGEEGPKLFIILDESVIRRQVGGPKVMRTQMERLAQLADHPRITLQVLPFSVGAHRGILGPFTLFEFSEEGMPDSVYLENPRGESYASNDPEITGKYLEAFWALEDQALLDGMGRRLRQVASHVGETVADLELTADQDQQEGATP